MKDWSAISVAILTLGLAAFVPANLDGVPDVLDGDTVFVAGARVRLEGIDAPEMDQVCLTSSGECWRCGEEARAHLAEKIGRQFVTCRANGEDRYGRTLATCRLGLGDVDLNAWMVREGLALSSTRYSHRYDGDEAGARESRRGLWAGAFVAPWDWRGRDKATVIYGAEAVPLKGRALLLRDQADAACRAQ